MGGGGGGGVFLPRKNFFLAGLPVQERFLSAALCRNCWALNYLKMTLLCFITAVVF